MTATMVYGAARVVDAGDYRVSIGAGRRQEFASSIAQAAPAHHYAVVSDDDVAPLYAEPLAAELARHGRSSLHRMSAGEVHKTRATWARLTDDLLAAGCGRDTTV